MARLLKEYNEELRPKIKTILAIIKFNTTKRVKFGFMLMGETK